MRAGGRADEPWPTHPDGSVKIAYCINHGLHGQRQSCFECNGPVKQVPMVSVSRAKQALEDKEKERVRSSLKALRLEAQLHTVRVLIEDIDKVVKVGDWTKVESKRDIIGKLVDEALAAMGGRR